MLYTIMGLSDMIIRLCYGGIIQLSCLSTMELYILFLIVAAVTQALTPLATAYHTLCLLAVSFGSFSGLVAVFPPLIIADILKIEEVDTGYGFMLVCQGAGFLAGAPVAGNMILIIYQHG